mgnify:CR=1 FL=1
MKLKLTLAMLAFSATAAQADSITAIAAADERFSTLVAAVTAAGLAETLAGPGHFTVFAPVDDAFAALPPGTVQTLVDNPPQLARILKYHVLAGAHARAELVAQPQWDSLEGAQIPIRRSEPFEVKNAHLSGKRASSFT